MIDPKVQEAIERARSEYDAMTPVDRELEADDQRRSWVRGETGTDPGPHVLAAEVRRLRSEIAAREARMREALTRIDALVPCIQRAAGMTRASLERLVEAIGAEARAALEAER